MIENRSFRPPLVYLETVRSLKHVDGAVAQLAAIFEDHFAKLPPDEREAKTHTFDRAVAKIGSRA